MKFWLRGSLDEASLNARVPLVGCEGPTGLRIWIALRRLYG